MSIFPNVCFKNIMLDDRIGSKIMPDSEIICTIPYFWHHICFGKFYIEIPNAKSLSRVVYRL